MQLVLFLIVYCHVAFVVYGAFALDSCFAAFVIVIYAVFALGKCLGYSSLLGRRLIVVVVCFGWKYP
ncbi:hypothetical protein U1Q18_014065 [Sarracenia purpurea var. burkii]